MLRTVFVDVDNTLLDFHACARDSIARALAPHGIPLTDAMFDVFNRINNGLWQELEQGKRSLDKLYADRFPMVFAALDMPMPQEDLEARFRENLDRSAVLLPGAEALLRYLHGKYTVCIASNAHQEQQRRRLELAGLLPYVHYLCTSESMGEKKPGTAFFDACFRQMPGASPESSIMLGDSLTADIQGASNYGMRTIWLDLVGEKDSKGFRPDYIVHSLEEVFDIL